MRVLGFGSRCDCCVSFFGVRTTITSWCLFGLFLFKFDSSDVCAKGRRSGRAGRAGAELCPLSLRWLRGGSC